jgi:sucrose-phosphate synthase
LPWRASKGDALRYCALKWGFLINNLLVAGDSGNDVSMLRGNTRAVVVGNHSRELDRLRTHPNIYFAEGHYAWGILEGLAHYQIPGFGDQLSSPLAHPNPIARFGGNHITGDRSGGPKHPPLQQALS